MKPDELAEIVATTIKAALSPILERVASLETRVSGSVDIRDRVVALETRALQPIPVTDLSPVAARIDDIERALGVARERIAAVEARPLPIAPDTEAIAARVAASVPVMPAVDLEPVLTRFQSFHDMQSVVADTKSQTASLALAVSDLTAQQQATVTLADTSARLLEDTRGSVSETTGRVTAIEKRLDAAATSEALAIVQHIVTQITSAMDTLRERLTALEARGDSPTVVSLTERVAVTERAIAEHKSIDLTPVHDRITATMDAVSILEKTWQSKLGALDAKVSEGPGPAISEQLSDAMIRLGVLEAEVSKPDPSSDSILRVTKQLDEISGLVGGMRERLAAVEMKPLIPGPAGRDGANGRDGSDGRDALDVDDFSAAFDQSSRTLSFTLMRGDRAKSSAIVLDGYPRWTGVYQDGQSYQPGDTTTWAGSVWHCNEPTTEKPGDGRKAWTLMVKRGRDGRDGRDLTGALPVVTRS